ncbi:MAG: hypothetical protein LJF30_09375 [Acidobacteria bacterium]|nr:hypothetical protein [Acidobacteriota bacterium]
MGGRAGRVGALVTALNLALAGLAAADGARVVSREEILQAMRHSQGYALTATSNGPRLQAEVLLRLIGRAREQDPERRPLFVGHQEWYEAFLERTGLSPERAPLYVRKAWEIGQDLVLDYRWERVVEHVVKGPRPRTVANVEIFWRDRPGRPKKLSYDDLQSDPTLRVTQKQLIRYRLVDYADRRWYADVSGLHGRPTSGPLGLLFKVLGEARVVESRSALSADGLHIVRGRGRKLGLTRVGTATVWPDGHARKGVPRGRPDLRALVRRLKEPLEIRFRPFEAPGAE